MLRACVRSCEARGIVGVHWPDAVQVLGARTSGGLLDDCSGSFATLDITWWVERQLFSDGVLE
jgi:hypothetical protein